MDVAADGPERLSADGDMWRPLMLPVCLSSVTVPVCKKKGPHVCQVDRNSATLVDLDLSFASNSVRIADGRTSIASDPISSRSTWILILSLTFFGRLRVRFGHRCSCELRRACQPRRLLQRLRAENAAWDLSHDFERHRAWRPVNIRQSQYIRQ